LWWIGALSLAAEIVWATVALKQLELPQTGQLQGVGTPVDTVVTLI
jgi:hypothetical protein